MKRRLLMVFTLALYGAAQAETNGAVRAQLVAHQSTVLSSDLPGRIQRLALREGDSFKKGDRLVELDCSLHRARLNKANAQLEEAAKVHEVNADLDRYGSVSNLELKVAGARMGAARAEVALMQAYVERCSIAAPFAGVVGEVKVKAHQYVGEGQELLTILDNSTLEIESIVPSRWLVWLKTGASLQVAVDETGKVYPARLVRIAPQIDAVSQSVKVFATLDQHHPELAAGMSGAAQFAVP